MKNLLTLAAACLIAFLAHAQSPDYSLRLKSGTFHLPPTIAEASAAAIHPAEEINGRYYRILQFYAMPTAVEREKLVAHDIRLTEYLPTNAFLASVPQEVDLAKLALNNLRASARISSAYKIAPEHATGAFPDYAIPAEGQLDLAVMVFPDLAQDDLRLFEKAGFAAKPLFPQVFQLTVAKEELKRVVELPFVQFVEPIPAPGEPETYTQQTLQRSNTVNTAIPGGRRYDGSGVVMAVGDDGVIGPHIDYQGRVIEQFTTQNLGNHGDHVAGTLIGGGNLDPLQEGVAPGANLYVYQYTTTDYFNSIPGAVVSDSVRVVSTSYSNGCNAGYTSLTRLLDQHTLASPELLYVFSAGNNGQSSCGYGAGSRWGNITGGHKIAKNVVTVGNLTESDIVVNSSSRGPSADGRIKPDLCAKGTSVSSTVDENEYEFKTGTSMSCPSVAAGFAQLYQAFRETQNSEPQSALLKAIALNTAEDLGNEGPDFIHGWGRMNVLEAVESIEDQQWMSGMVTHEQVQQHQLQIPAGVKEARIMLYWPDVEASIWASPALVNDLDVVIEDGATNYQPLVLDHTPSVQALSTPATPGRDSMNNMEQVVLKNPSAGTVEIAVDGHAVPFGSQNYFIVYHFIYDEVVVTHPIGGEPFMPGQEQRIMWDAYGNSGSFTIDYSTDSGSTWNSIASNMVGSSRQFDWTVPQALTANALIRISRGSVSGTSTSTFTIAERPENSHFTLECSSFAELTWDSVAGATAYEVLVLEDRDMVPIDTTTGTSLLVGSLLPDSTYWMSVRMLGSDGLASQRTIAIRKEPGATNCTLDSNLAVSKVHSPSPVLPSCLPGTNVPVTVEITNMGRIDIRGTSVSYSLNGSTPISEPLDTTVSGSSSVTHTFQVPVTLANNGPNELLVVLSSPGDQEPFDDTLRQQLGAFSSSIQPLPYLQNFDNLTPCSTDGDCGLNICNLNSSIQNVENGVYDDIDFRVNQGGTPSTGTGPSSDHTTGSRTGNYIYLEATNCFGHRGILLLPCFDLSQSIQPELEFAYHMEGEHINDLQAQVYWQNQWTTIHTISGDQGTDWQVTTLDLSAYNGDTISIRFVGQTGMDYRSDIALDDIHVQDAVVPTAAFTIEGYTCTETPITFTDKSSGPIDNRTWNFGNGATPATATGPGPHIVTYSTTGHKTIELETANSMANNQFVDAIVVNQKPEVDFSYTIVNDSIYFQNLSQGARTYMWDFGDGNTSPFAEPRFAYSDTGWYSVTLICFSDCAPDTAVKEVHITSVPAGLSHEESQLLLRVVPNPSTGNYQLHIPALSAPGHLSLMNVSGKLLWNRNLEENQRGQVVEMHIEHLPPGVYFLRLTSEEAINTVKVLKE